MKLHLCEKQELLKKYEAIRGVDRAFFLRSGMPDENAVILRADEDGQTLGYAVLKKFDTLLPVMDLYVDEALRGKGVGREMCRQVQQFCQEQGCGGVLALNYSGNLRGTVLMDNCEFKYMGLWKDNGSVYAKPFARKPADMIEYDGIRPFRADDGPRVQAFFDKLGPEASAFFNRRRGNEKASMLYFDPAKADAHKNRRNWLYEENGVMHGYVFLWDVDTGLPGLGICVSEEAKGKHLGRRLIACAADYARRSGAGGIELTTHAANIRGQMLYERMGFLQYGMQGCELFYIMSLNKI